MRGRAHIGAGLAAAAVGGLLPGTAQASYSPTLSIAFQPATAATAPAVSSTLTYNPGDTPSKTIRIHYPPGFGFNPGFDVAGCSAAQESSNSCPASSQIGTAGAVTTIGNLSGPVYFTSDYRLLIYLSGPGGVAQSKFVGYFQDTPDGGFDAVIDNLPDFPASSSSISLEGGSRSPLLTPGICGTYPIVGHFTSQNGEQASSTATVHLTGCDTQPAFERAWVTPRSFRASARGPVGVLRWELSGPGARTTVWLERLLMRNGLEVRRTLWSRAAGATVGVNQLRFRAASGRRRLPPGRYAFVLAAYSQAGRPSDRATVPFAVRAGRS
jgi:hypothetical protein